MGYIKGIEFADLAARGRISLRESIEYHLTSNHFPSVPLDMITPAVKAINACNIGRYDEKIQTPYPHKDHGKEVPAHVIVNSLHLEPWIDDSVSEEEV